jgi:DNA-binding XRE family transcriptional regulator
METENIFTNGNHISHDNEYYVGNWQHIQRNRGINDKERERRRINHLKKQQKEASLTDVQRYYIEQNKYMINLIRKYRKTHDNSLNDKEGFMFPVSMKEAMETGKVQTEYCYGCGLNYPQYEDYRFVHNKICKNCSNLPLIYYPHINSTPAIIEKYEKRVENERVLKVHSNVNFNKRMANENNVTAGDLKYFDKEFIDYVKENRIKMNLKQEQFARRINCNTKLIYDLERGELLFDSELKQKICSYFT